MAAMDMSSDVSRNAASDRAHDRRATEAGRWPVWKSLALLLGTSLAAWALIILGAFLVF